MPTGLGVKARSQVVLPSGVKEKAQLGLSLLKDAVLELARANPKGISNSLREGKLERQAGTNKHVARID